MEILLIAFLAVLANASTWKKITCFGETDSDSLQKATVGFLMENMAAIRCSLGLPMDGCRLICVDGKEQRAPYYRLPASYGKDEWEKLKSLVCFEKYTYQKNRYRRE